MEAMSISVWWRAYAQNVRHCFPFRQYTNFLYFNLYLNIAYGAHYVYLTFVHTSVCLSVCLSTKLLSLTVGPSVHPKLKINYIKCIFFLELLVLIPKFSKRSSFFCSSTFLDEAAENPTSFCQFQGALIHYMSLVTGELFVIYNVMLLKVCKRWKLCKIWS